MDILLVLPNVFLSNRIGDHESKEPLGLLYLTSVLRENGYNASVLQADFYGLSPEQTAQIIQFHNPAVVGFSVTQRAAVATLKIINLLKQNNFKGHIAVGGYLASLSTKDLLGYCEGIDSIVVGEGEHTFLELVQCLDSGKDWHNVKSIAYKNKGKVIFTEPRPAIADLDTLPFPARDLLSDAFHRMGYATLISSRGCYANCTFCSQNSFKRKNPGAIWRGRSPKNVVDELEMINKNFGIHTFKFNDDNIFGPGRKGKERIVAICEEIIRRKLSFNLMAYCRITDVESETMKIMRKAGFERLLIGVETIILSVLKKYRKGITPEQVKAGFNLLVDLGFSVIPGFMIFNPYSSIDNLETDLNFLDEIKGYGVSISKNLKVHDSTQIRESLLREGKLNLMPFYQGYHEYIIDNDVARVYKMLKLVWSRWLDPVQAEGQDIITQMKKSESFNTRQQYDDYLKIVWKIQAELFLEIINWVRAGDITRKQMKPAVQKFYSKIIDLKEYLNTKRTKGNLRAKKYLLYPFVVKGEKYCLDMITSKIFPVDSDLQKALHILISEQSSDALNSKNIQKIRRLESQNIIGHLPPRKKVELMGIDEMISLIWEVYNDYTLNTMTEKYFWSKTK